MPKPRKVSKVKLLTHKQVCLYCHKDFVPVRRGTQKHCSNSCRVSYCRKKSQGTLHRVKQLPGPARAAAPFGDLYLAATAGALTANTVTQTAEYYLVTQKLLAEQAQLRQQMQQQQLLHQQQQALLHQQNQLLAHLQQDQQRLLQALGVPPEPLPAPRPTWLTCQRPSSQPRRGRRGRGRWWMILGPTRCPAPGRPAQRRTRTSDQ